MVVDNTVYVSGVIGLDPRTSILVPGGVESQTRQALRSLKAILETSGSNLCKVVKTTILLTNINDFNIVNEVYKECKYDTDNTISNFYIHFFLCTCTNRLYSAAKYIFLSLNFPN